jgi:hypothetical protein
VIASLLFQTPSSPVTDRATSSWPEIIKAASTNGYALFGLVVLVVGLGLLIGAKDWAKVVGALALIAGAILVIFGLSNVKKSPIALTGTVLNSVTKTPLHNAEVTFQLGTNGEKLTDHTDSAGLYRILLDAQWVDQTGRAAAHKEQFDDQDVNIVVAQSLSRYDFNLPPLDQQNTNPPPPFGQQPAAQVNPEPAQNVSYLSIPVTKSSGNKASGVMAGFSPWYDLCLDPPVAGCTLESPEYSLRGDRKCNEWSECKLTKNTADQMCFSFRMQGHSESPYPGQSYSEGVLTAKCKLPVNPKSPLVRTVSRGELIRMGIATRDNDLVGVSLSAPGKIVYIEYSCNGEGCGWIHQCGSQASCPKRTEYNDSTAMWYGMTNSAAPALLTFKIYYQ